MSSELRQTIAAAIRRSLWTYWGDHVPDGDASLASLSNAGQAGYVDAAAAILAVLPPSITAEQRRAIDAIVQAWGQGDMDSVHDAVGNHIDVLLALAAGPDAELGS